MVGPHVEHFTDGVCKQTRKHHARRVREHGTDGFSHRIACRRDVQEPALRNQNERDVRKNANLDAAARFFFAEDFTHDVGREECRSEDDVAERGIEPEGVYQNKHFDVCGNRANDGPGKNALLAEEAEEGDEAPEEGEDRGDEDKFVLHK